MTDDVARTGRLAFRVKGMDCAEEVGILKRELGPMVGGDENLAFDVLSGKMTVAGTAGVTPRDVVEAVARTGMAAEPWPTTLGPGIRPDGRARLTWTSGLLTLAALAWHAVSAGGLLQALDAEGLGHGGTVPLAARVLYVAAICSGAWFVLPKAWFAARRLSPDMNLLMTIAVIGAIGIGEWFEAATVSFLFSLALTLESWSVARARRAMEALLAVAPPTVHLVDGRGPSREVPASSVPPGATFVVKPGERFGLDGVVIRGDSHVNEAPITGESMPVPKAAGSTVFAGSVNGEGSLDVRSTKPADETTLAHIAKLVREAHAKRAPSELWVDRFARVYTPSVLLLAVLVMLAPPLLLGLSWEAWFYRGLVLLVIGCPCALVISTPVSIVASLAAAARNGVLIKGNVHVEAPARLKALAIDKTGTLTEGRPRVVDVVSLDGHSPDDIVAVAAAMAGRNDHPLLRAIARHAQAAGVSNIPQAHDSRALPGRGVEGHIGDHLFWAGSHRLLEERGQETAPMHDRLEAMAQGGRTVVVVGEDDHVCGMVALSDTIRPEARAALDSLRSLGIHVAMLTGDNLPTAQAIARDLHIDDVRAELLPADKVAAIEDLARRYGTVAMAGDGINDAAALARASVGIAMGAAGNDAAIETADIALMSDDLLKLPWLVRHSRRTLAVVRQNIAMALLVKAVFVGLAVLGFASLWAAIAADMGASLAVISNGLRLLRESAPGAPGTPDLGSQRGASG